MGSSHTRITPRGRGITLAVGLLLWGGGLPDVPSARAAGARDSGKTLRTQVKHRHHVRVSIDSLEVAPTAKDGSPWDDDGTAPDVVVKVSVNGRTIQRGPFESLTPTIGVGPIAAPIGSTFAIRVYDRDDDGDVLIGYANWTDGRTAGFQVLSAGSVPQIVLTSTHVSAWTIPEISVMANFPVNGSMKKHIAAGLDAFNQRLSASTGGQLRVAKFSVYTQPWPARVTSTTRGIHLSRRAPKGACPKAHGTPGVPAAVRVSVPSSAADAQAFSRRALHAFAHAYLGLHSKKRPRKQTHRYCFSTKAGLDASCLRAATPILKKRLGLTLLSSHKAPPASPTPRIDFVSDDTVDANDTDTGTPLEDAVINKVLAGHGTALGRCLVRSGARSAKIRFAIRGADGKVGWVMVNDKGSGGLQRCVRSALRSVRFPTATVSRTVARFEMNR